MTGRCYCGASSLTANVPPHAISYCHCSDCRRVSGAPVAAFTAFALDDISFAPALGVPTHHTATTKRWFCVNCGSPLAACFDYLPGQIYVPLGLLDQAPDLPPQLHSHWGEKLSWLNIHDDMPKADASARTALANSHKEK
ncbi:GFA family protein [Sulfitobacter sp. 1151]|uniref:GFA family protein n=1 Tax=Parasulfitobacter algicola TaxID=2614809 RepID=A0ABX2INI9_9RHOB|nr:GFA family protein [Sulfitobacter algicola]